MEPHYQIQFGVIARTSFLKEFLPSFKGCSQRILSPIDIASFQDYMSVYITI